jgi:hypothetical protein
MVIREVNEQGAFVECKGNWPKDGTLLTAESPLTANGRSRTRTRPLRQNRCRLDRTTYPGAETRSRVGTIWTELQEQSGGAAVAAGECFPGGGGS